MDKKILINKENLNLKSRCNWYPCHENISDEEYNCTTCYCPIYEECSKSENTIFGGYKLNDTIWACERCTYIHRNYVVKYMEKLKKANYTNLEILELLIEMYREEAE